jgi:hypothetical protein
MSNNLKIGFYDNDLGEALNGVTCKISIALGVTDGKTYYDTSDILFENKGTSENGELNFDLNELMSNSTLIKYYRLYNEKYKIEFKIIVEVPKTDTYNYLITKISILPKILYSDKNDKYYFDDYDYINNNDFIYLTAIDPNVQKTITSLKAEFKAKELEYNIAKTLYETEIKGTTDIKLENENEYEPPTFKNIITRLLEFKEGTLTPSIKYTSEAKLTDINTKLVTISKIISLITKQYPDITIDDGEGIPYQNII